MHTDGRTDRQKDMAMLIGAFHYHVNTPKNTHTITIILMHTIVH